MEESKEQILSKKFEDIEIYKIKPVYAALKSFLVGVGGSALVSYMWSGWPEQIKDFIFRSLSAGFVLAVGVTIYSLYKKNKCYEQWIDIQKQQKEILEEEKEEYSKQIKVLEGKQITKSGSEVREENIEKFMYNFVNNTQGVEAVQIHEYKMIPEGKDIIITIELKTQYLRKNQRHYLNAITNYYKVDARILQKFFEVKDHYESDSEPRMKVLKEIEDLMQDISNKRTEEHVKIYDILISMAANINEFIGGNYILNNTTPQEESAVTATEDIVVEESQEESVVTVPENKKRTGILGGVIYETGYSYDYEKENEEKENRKYYSLCGDDDDIIITFILDTSLSYGDKLKGLIDDIMEVYNSMKEDYKVGESNERKKVRC